MVKHTQTIRRQQFINCLTVFDHFVGLVLKGLKMPCYPINTRCPQIVHMYFNKYAGKSFRFKYV